MEIAAPAFEVTETSAVAEARRIATSLCASLGMTETVTGRVAIAATEMATNLLKHGGGGEFLASIFADDSGTGLQMLALDKGPGMTDISACMRDGYSSAGSAGSGLGSIRRLSDVFDIASWPGKGTAVLSRIFLGGAPRPPKAPDWAGVCLPMRGETANGDGWAAYRHDGNISVLLADGLGHGPSAAQASRAATVLFATIHKLGLPEIASRLHDALRPTRGAAIAVARIAAGQRNVEFIGIGNIAGTMIAAGQVRRMVSHNGTAGHNAHKIQSFKYDCAEPPLVVMHSDGLGTSWALDRYPGLMLRHKALIAGVLYRDFYRGRDDVTVAVAGAGA